MQAIETVTVGSGGAASITFSSIPDTYTDLMIVVSSRSTVSGVNDALDLLPNGASGNNSLRYLRGDGSSVQSGSETTNLVSYTPGATTTSDTFGNASIYITNYTSTSSKSISTDGVGENNATSVRSAIIATLHSGTTAFTSLELSLRNGNFVEHSTATLYGILAGSDGSTTVT